MDDVGDGMKRSELRGNAKTNDPKETEDIPTLQPVRKLTRSELRIVGPHLPKSRPPTYNPSKAPQIAYDLELRTTSIAYLFVVEGWTPSSFSTATRAFYCEVLLRLVTGDAFRAAVNCIYPERSSSFNSTQEGSNAFEPLAVTALNHFEPFTPAAVLLVQRISGNEKAILKLADRRLGHRGGKVGPVPWSPSLEGHLKHALRGIQEGMAPNWFELIRDDENRPDIRIGYGRSPLGVTSCRYIPRLLSVIRLRITPESTTLPLMTDVVQGLVFEYIPGISMAKLEPDVDVSEQGAERISSQVMEALRAIEAENCLLHNDVHIGNVVLRDGSRSLVIIDFGQANVREPDEEWSSAIWGSPEDTLHEKLSDES
ncbi:hypothetical protein ARMGADRAFT_1091010 [Armillaria gallica]|uniref:Protein kinase domain-containing protein n=1 Tax=Armillaria gallica TaxID=47427 RepID=A0A2H3CRD9_ARMGA|nr:hypothetical protein ARMGADRAFT_1091010 [Armillaria gallica]